MLRPVFSISRRRVGPGKSSESERNELSPLSSFAGCIRCYPGRSSPCDGWIFFNWLRHETNWDRVAGVVVAQDSLAAGTNPAEMVLVGDRFDLGLTYFRPISASITGSLTPVSGS